MPMGKWQATKQCWKKNSSAGFSASLGFDFNLQLQELLHLWSLHTLKAVSLLIFVDHWFLLLSVIAVWYSSGHTVGEARDLKEKKISLLLVKRFCAAWLDAVLLWQRLAAGKLTHFADPLNSQWSPDCDRKDGWTSLGSVTLHGPVHPDFTLRRGSVMDNAGLSEFLETLNKSGCTVL